MLEIEKPRIECIEEKGGSYAKFVVEPLEKGFGVRSEERRVGKECR